jgi:hypothetical protein
MITHNKTGGRTVELYIPFDFNGKRIDSITFSALRFGHVLRWSAGEYKTMMDLMVEMSGVEVNVIRELRYPDAERVVETFLSLMTPELRDNIATGQVPVKPEEYQQQEQQEEEPRTTNGSGMPPDPTMLMRGPGAPLPEAGFDMSEEP